MKIIKLRVEINLLMWVLLPESDIAKRELYDPLSSRRVMLKRELRRLWFLYFNFQIETEKRVNA